MDEFEVQKRLGTCYKSGEKKFKTKKIRKEQETWNIIQNLILSYPNLPYLILTLS